MSHTGYPDSEPQVNTLKSHVVVFFGVVVVGGGGQKIRSQTKFSFHVHVITQTQATSINATIVGDNNESATTNSPAADAERRSLPPHQPGDESPACLKCVVFLKLPVAKCSEVCSR